MLNVVMLSVVAPLWQLKTVVFLHRFLVPAVNGQWDAKLI
jgi:hypothetical protein